MSETDPGAAMDLGEIRSYTRLAAKLLGIHLADEEIEPVSDQVVRVAALVDRMDRIDDDEVTSAPRFVAGASATTTR